MFLTLNAPPEPAILQVKTISHNFVSSPPVPQSNSDSGGEFAMIEHWTDRASLDAHLKTDHVREFGEKSKDLREGPTDIAIYKTCGI